MRRRTSSRRSGRPRSPSPLFVEDCGRFDATLLLAKTRGGPVDDELSTVSITSTWTEQGRQGTRTVVLAVVSTPQPFGGVRRWWRCPTCRRRCRILLMASTDSPVACRRCLRAVYSTDYPARHYWRQLSPILCGLLHEGTLLARDAALDAARETAPRGASRTADRAACAAVAAPDVGADCQRDIRPRRVHAPSMTERRFEPGTASLRLTTPLTPWIGC